MEKFVSFAILVKPGALLAPLFGVLGKKPGRWRRDCCNVCMCVCVYKLLVFSSFLQGFLACDFEETPGGEI